MNDLNLHSKCSSTEANDENATRRDNAFVGIKYETDDVHIYFPIGYDIPEDDDECRKSILTLLRTISLSKNILNSEAQLNDSFKEDYAFPVSAYLWLIKDYFTSGIYHSTEKFIKKNPEGKINWKRTLRDTPLYSNGSFAYLNQYTEHNIAIDNIITEIHILCLNEAFRKIGFLFGKFKLIDSFIDFDNKDYLINVLNNALINAHEDRKQQLLINLRNVLLGLDILNNQQHIKNYGIEGFHQAWEVIVRTIFGNQEVSKLAPVAKYDGEFIKGQKTKTPLRLDALLVRNGNYYILDAKYYHFGVDMIWNSAPETTDVEKQVVYGEYLDLKYEGKRNIYNSFIIPYNKENNNNHDVFKDNIEFVGYSTVSWKDYVKDIKPYYFVAIILVDCKFALESFVNGANNNLLDDIAKTIDEVIPLIKKYGWSPITTIDKE